WNWPYNRKEMKIYGQSGYVFCRDTENMTVFKSKEKKATDKAAPALKEDRNDAFSYFARVVRGDINPQPYDLSALPNNEVVVKILELAKKSAESGKTIMWKEYFK
ncbi:MAG: gfo/Idh/MocA family oxidoreductase, partial [Petrimonas sp.]|nr:gfo/Idh/MocA family oxidoreductase [Petrimonas sp.]